MMRGLDLSRPGPFQASLIAWALLAVGEREQALAFSSACSRGARRCGFGCRPRDLTLCGPSFGFNASSQNRSDEDSRLIALLIGLACPQGLAGQAPSPTATAHVVVTPPVIDGRLTDPAWAEATPITGFVQRELHEGAPITERTEVRIVTDGQALYVGAWLYDTDPSGIVPGEKVRDGDISKSDYFGILLDTYHDRQNGFVFTTTPAAIEYDAQVVNEGEGGGIQLPGQTRASAGSLGGFNLNWDGTWTVATSVDSAGWYSQIRIPFTTLRYAAGEQQTWGLNLVRSIRR